MVRRGVVRLSADSFEDNDLDDMLSRVDALRSVIHDSIGSCLSRAFLQCVNAKFAKVRSSGSARKDPHMWLKLLEVISVEPS